jgi:hypothetical protein
MRGVESEERRDVPEVPSWLHGLEEQAVGQRWRERGLSPVGVKEKGRRGRTEGKVTTSTCKSVPRPGDMAGIQV